MGTIGQNVKDPRGGPWQEIMQSKETKHGFNLWQGGHVSLAVWSTPQHPRESFDSLLYVFGLVLLFFIKLFF